MKKLVFIPLDGTKRLLETGFSIGQIERMYNPGYYFDEVYVVSVKDEVDDYGTLIFIKAKIEEIKGLIKKINPVAVRANAGYFCCDIALACRVKGIPIMISVHDARDERIRQSLVYADKVVCISEAVKEAVNDITDVKDDNILMMPRYVELDIFKRRFDQNFFNILNSKYGSGKHILHVGRKSYEKNIETTIEALKYLPDDYSLVQIGLGDEGEYLELAKKLGVSNRVFFTGGIPQDELAFYYSWADCMCTPSRREGFGLVFIEACACECPVITSDIGPMNEYLSNDKSGVLVKEYENPKEIAKAILRVCTDKKLRDELKEGGKKVGKKYSISNADKIEIENYQRLIEEFDDSAEKAFEHELEKLSMPFVIYGAGNNGIAFYENMKRYNRKPLYFIDCDKNKVGKKIEDISIVDYSKVNSADRNFVVVITPYLHADIVQMLKKDGFSIMELEWYENLLRVTDMQTECN